MANYRTSRIALCFARSKPTSAAAAALGQKVRDSEAAVKRLWLMPAGGTNPWENVQTAFRFGGKNAVDCHTPRPPAQRLFHHAELAIARATHGKGITP